MPTFFRVFAIFRNYALLRSEISTFPKKIDHGQNYEMDSLAEFF